MGDEKYVISKNGKYMYNNGEQEGCSATEIWHFFNLLPINTNFTLEISKFCIESGRCEVVDSVNFIKNIEELPEGCGNCLPAGLGKQKMKNLFAQYGFKGYSKFEMIWNRGFGNSVIFKILL